MITTLESATDKKRKVTLGTKEWADRNVNCVKGCYNNCRYCYAKVIAKRFGRCTENTWQTMEVNSRIVEKSFRKYDGRIMFPSSHDISGAPEVEAACLEVMDKLLEAGNNLLITTKPRLRVVKNIVRKMKPFQPQIQFRFTITSLDNGTLAFWEPNAPNFEERLGSLRYAYEKGFKTSVSIEPFLDNDPLALIKTVVPFVTESVWVGIMNYIPRNGIPERDQRNYDAIRQTYETVHLRQVHEQLKGLPLVRFKDSLTNRLGVS